MQQTREVEVTGSLVPILMNDELLYTGDLQHYFRVIWDNAQNLEHPYHNFHHMFYVLFRCHDAVRYYEDEYKKFNSIQHLIAHYQKRSLLIAAMFHDFNHSGLFGDDDLNIERAKRGLRRHVSDVDIDFLPEIEEYIDATQFPHKKVEHEDSLPVQIIRDADMMQCLEPSWIQQNIFGLSKEWGMTSAIVLKRQIPFLNSIRFRTEWARERFPQSSIDAKIKEAQGLLGILGL